MTSRVSTLSILSLVLFVYGAQSAFADEKDQTVFELRTYTTHDGKLDDLHARFRDHTNRIFKKHGIGLVGYWTPTDPDKSKNTLVYMISHKSMDAAKASWAAFREDPEWRKVARESQKDGKIVKKVQSTYLRATDYSPIQ